MKLQELQMLSNITKINEGERNKESLAYEYISIQDCIDDRSVEPFPISVIPNHMGINLCSVAGFSTVRLPDGQLEHLIIHFIPNEEEKSDKYLKSDCRIEIK